MVEKNRYTVSNTRNQNERKNRQIAKVSCRRSRRVVVLSVCFSAGWGSPGINACRVGIQMMPGQRHLLAG